MVNKSKLEFDLKYDQYDALKSLGKVFYSESVVQLYFHLCFNKPVRFVLRGEEVNNKGSDYVVMFTW